MNPDEIQSIKLPLDNMSYPDLLEAIMDWSNQGYKGVAEELIEEAKSREVIDP